MSGGLGQVSDAASGQDFNHGGAHIVPERDLRGRPGTALGGFAVTVGILFTVEAGSDSERALKRLDDGVEPDLLGRQGQPVPALSAAHGGDEAGRAQPCEHLPDERTGNPLTLSDFGGRDRIRSVALSKIDQGTNAVVTGAGQLHHGEGGSAAGLTDRDGARCG